MASQGVPRPVFLPVIIGTPRQGRLTEPAANFVFGEVSKRNDIETELIDIRKIPVAMMTPAKRLKTASSLQGSRGLTDLSWWSRNTITVFRGC